MKQSLPNDSVILEPIEGRSILPTLYAGAIIIAGLYFGRELMVPLVMAALLAFVLAPACGVLERIGLPRVATVLIVVFLAFATIGGLGAVVGRQAASLAASLPAYKTTIATKWAALTTSFGSLDLLREIGASGDQTQGAAAALGMTDVSGLSLARSLALPFLSPLATGGIVLVFTFFILLSNDDLRDRLVRLVGRQDLHRTILAMNDAARRLSRYFLYQLALNASFGLAIGLCLWAAGLPNPLLWGILAALMRFIPFVGIIIAAIPPVLLAVAIVPGWSLGLGVLALFVVAETITGQVIEPLIYGHNTGLSPIAIIVATAFWALLWGPIGLLIATPLTVCLVVIGRHVEGLSFLDVILGDTAPLDPPETFYQRALEGRGATLAPGAKQHIADSSLIDYYDKVALPGLALAQGDLARDSLAFERLEAIHGQIQELLGIIESEPTPSGSADVVPAAWRDPETIVCIPGRGQLDDLAATMAVQALNKAGFGARPESNLALGSPQAMSRGMSGARLCCLSILEQGSTVSAIRYFIKRVQKQMPETAIVVCLWHADRDSALLAALRAAEGANEHLVLSIGELLAFCHALAARSAA